MHLSEGILSGPVLLSGAVLAATGTAIGLRAIRDDDIPRVAMLTTAFFVASLVHIPIGPGSAHLILSGLCGLLLGRRAFPAILVALFLQAVLFGFGGLTALGVNTVVLAGPAAFIGEIARSSMSTRSTAAQRAPLIAALVSAGSLACSALLAALALYLSNRAFIGPATLILAAHIPIMIAEALLTAGIAAFLLRVRPNLLMEEA